MDTFIVVGTSTLLLRQTLLAIRGFSDGRCIVAGSEKTRVLRRSRLCEQHVELKFDRSDDERFSGFVNGFSGNMARTALIAADCDGAKLISRIRDRLHIGAMPIPDASMLHTFSNRWNFHQFCVEHGLRVATAAKVSVGTGCGFEAAAMQLGAPFVIKPLDVGIARGIWLARDRNEYAKAMCELRASGARQAIAQQLVPGTDMSLDLLAVRGRLQAFAIRQKAGREIHFFANDYLENLAHGLPAASGYHGVISIDARIEAHTGKMYLTGAAPGFSEGLTAAASCGLNFIAESLLPARRNHSVLALTAGAVSRRHPLVRPSSWLRMIAGSGAESRLLRARMSDLPSLMSESWSKSFGLKQAARKSVPAM